MMGSLQLPKQENFSSSSCGKNIFIIGYFSGSQTVSRSSLGSRGFLPGEPRTITICHNFMFFINLFKFADVDILQSILDIWSAILICSVIMCYVYNSVGTRLHATE